MDTQTCTMCKEQKKSFWCKGCTCQEIRNKRSQLQVVWNARAVLENQIEKILQVIQQHNDVNRRKEEAQIHRKRLEELIEHHRQRVAEDKSRIQRLQKEHVARRMYIQKCFQLLRNKKNLVRTRIPQTTNQLSKDLREYNLSLRAGNRNLIKKLLELYVITREDKEHCTICALPLRNNMTDEAEDLFERKQIIAHSFSRGSDMYIHDRIPCSCRGCCLSCTRPRCALQAQFLCRRSFSALGYIIFVLSRIACYLSVKLPHKMYFLGSHSKIRYTRTNREDFLSLEGQTASPESFQRALCMLDDNIYYLARRTSIDISRLKPRHLLPNMLTLINTLCEINTTYQQKHIKQPMRWGQSQQLSQPYNSEYSIEKVSRNYKARATFQQKKGHWKNSNKSLQQLHVQNLEKQFDKLTASDTNSDLGSLTESSLTDSSGSIVEENAHNFPSHSNFHEDLREDSRPLHSKDQIPFPSKYPPTEYPKHHISMNAPSYSIPLRGKRSMSSDEWYIINHGIDYPPSIPPK